MESTLKVSEIAQQLIDAGFEFVHETSEIVVVQDPRWKNYRVYSALENPEEFHWIESDHEYYDSVSDIPGL